MKPILYIFLHIPKCGGNTIFKHIQEHLGEKSVQFMYKDNYKNVRLQPSEKFISERASDLDIIHMSQSDRNAMKVLAGHHVYYGIHKHFPDKECRYITFVRDPAEIPLSFYTYGLNLPKHRFLYKTIFKDGDWQSITQWIKFNWYYVNNFLTRFLCERSFIVPKNFNYLTIQEIMDGLGKIDYIGLCDNKSFNNFFKMLGIPQNASPKNKTKPYKDYKLDKKYYVKYVEPLIPLDRKFYNCVKEVYNI